MDSYDNWKTSDPKDTPKYWRYCDAFDDAGYCDKYLAPRIEQFENFVGPIMKWLEAGVDDWDAAPVFYHWLVEGVALEFDELQDHIIDDWCERSGVQDWQGDWNQIEAIEAMHDTMSNDVLHNILA